MDRRAFISAVGGSLLTAPLAAHASEKMHRIGVLLWPPNLSIGPLRSLLLRADQVIACPEKGRCD